MIKKILCWKKTIKITLKFPFGNSYVWDVRKGCPKRCWMFPKVDMRSKMKWAIIEAAKNMTRKEWKDYVFKREIP